jgi:hypothetical protein
MAVLAASLAGVDTRWAHAPSGVLAAGNGVKMVGANAWPIPAQVIQGQALTYGPNQHRVNDSMSHVIAIGAFAHGAVSVAVFGANPVPATILGDRDLVAEVWIKALKH